jgi:hypothetical protein
VTIRSETIRQGVVVGLIGYAAVAVFYTVFDVLAARGSLFTVDLLGKAVFRGFRDPAILQLPVRIDADAVLLYNALHLGAALVIGQVVTHLVALADRKPRRGPAVLLVLVGGFVATVLAVGWLTGTIRPLLPWWSIVVANAAAVLLAGGWLVTRRPNVTRHLLGRG